MVYMYIYIYMISHAKHGILSMNINCLKRFSLKQLWLISLLKSKAFCWTTSHACPLKLTVDDFRITQTNNQQPTTNNCAWPDSKMMDSQMIIYWIWRLKSFKGMEASRIPGWTVSIQSSKTARPWLKAFPDQKTKAWSEMFTETMPVFYDLTRLLIWRNLHVQCPVLCRKIVTKHLKGIR